MGCGKGVFVGIVVGVSVADAVGVVVNVGVSVGNAVDVAVGVLVGEVVDVAIGILVGVEVSVAGTGVWVGTGVCSVVGDTVTMFVSSI